MKKLLLTATLLMGFATISHGSAILWSVDNTAIKDFTVSGDTITDSTSNLSGANLYFFLGTATATDVESAFTGTTFDETKLSTFLESTTSNGGGGKVKGTTPVENSSISSSTANDFFLVISTVKDDKSYYKLVTGSAVGYETTGDPLPPTTTMQFTRASVQNTGWTAAPAVPEPATAALALAGLALLIRRRKA